LIIVGFNNIDFILVFVDIDFNIIDFNIIDFNIIDFNIIDLKQF